MSPVPLSGSVARCASCLTPLPSPGRDPQGTRAGTAKPPGSRFKPSSTHYFPRVALNLLRRGDILPRRTAAQAQKEAMGMFYQMQMAPRVCGWSNAAPTTKIDATVTAQEIGRAHV